MHVQIKCNGPDQPVQPVQLGTRQVSGPIQPKNWMIQKSDKPGENCTNQQKLMIYQLRLV